MKLKLKSKIVLFISVFLVCSVVSVYSQGVFKNNTPPTQDNTSTTSTSGVFAAPPGGPGDIPPGGVGPVGEGLAILSILSGGYIMLKKRNSKREQ